MVKIIKRHWSFLAKTCFLLFFFVSIFLSSKFFYSNPTPTMGAWLATTTWIGGTTGNWQNAANWDNGIPTSTVLAIISSSTAITITATGTLDFDTLYVGGGTASSTLILEGNIGAGVDINIKNNGKITQSSTVQQTISGTLLIESGGMLNHARNTTAQARIVNFNANTITVNSGGAVSSTGVGYGAGQGPGVSIGATAGGAHGGNGGNGVGVGGQGYCDITSVGTIGSGGGDSTGGVGGGLIILTATGTITINGSITANGQTGVSANTGGGAGGGIKLTANIIAGTPTSFTADGGNGNNGYGGGGGGCVDIFYTTSNTITPTSSYFSISGGTGTVANYRGGGGMALVKQTGVNNGGLYVLDGGLTLVVTQPTSTVPAITADFIYVSSSIFQVTSSKTFTLSNANPFLGNNLGEIRVYGSMVPSAGTFTSISSTTLTIGPGGSVAVSSTFTVSSSLNLYRGFIGIATDTFTNLIIQTGTTTVYNYTTSSPLFLTSLTMNSSSILTHTTNTAAQTNILNVSSTGNITINSGAIVTGNSLGYTATNGRGVGSGFNAGGGHGGDGNDYTLSTNGGRGYCDITNVGTIGSGGSYTAGSGGGVGGGLIILSATGTITLDGSMVADGSNGGSANTGGGGGGGIKLTADVIAGTPINFTAKGGNGVASAGGGGGGCVDIFFTTSNTITPTSSYFSITGGTGDVASHRGGGGMALIKQNGVNNGGLFVLNVGVTTAVTQPTSTAAAITADFIYVSSSIFQVTSSKTFTLSNSDPFLGNNSGEIRVYGRVTSTVNTFTSINSTTLTIGSGGSVAVSSTFTVSSSLNLYKGFIGIATDTFTNLIIQTGSTTVYNYTTSSPLLLSNLTMNGGFLTHGVNATYQSSTLNVSSTGNITINSGASINVSSTGYAATKGPGVGSGNNAGGGHGGDGNDLTATTNGGRGYCDITNVGTIGSGASYFSGGSGGGPGGGLIILTAVGTITLNGFISADGGNGVSLHTGGGGGGGIKLTADVIAGTPTSFSARGGNGVGSAGGGGGGCVDIFYTTSNSITPTSTYFSITGGTGDTASHRGGAGMALIKQTGVNNGGLFVINAGSATAVTQPTSTAPAITADYIYVSSSVFIVSSSNTLTLANSNPFFGNNLGEIRVYGSLVRLVGAFDSISSTTLTIGSGARFSASSTFIVSSSLNLYRGFIGIATDTFANLIIQTGTTTLFNYNTTTVPLSLTSLTMNSSSILTSATNTTAQSSVIYIVASSTIIINAGASVIANATGYTGGATNIAGNGPGYGSSTAAKGGGGGAHGGNGGAGAVSGGSGGTAYCNSTNPVTMGSGGGGGNGQAGEAGGGLIMFSATGTLTINGNINANGKNTTADGGGGGGGGIKLVAETVAGTPQSFTANGGNGGTTGGGGGGGCIYIQYVTSNSITSAIATTTFGTSGTGGVGSVGTFQAVVLNSAPTITNIFPRQTSASIITVTTTIADSDSNGTSLAVLYSTDGVTWASSTIAAVDENGVGNGVSTSTGLISGIDTNVSGSITLTFEWNAGADIANTEDTTVYIKITPNDGTIDGTAVSSTAFAVDTKAPTAPGNLVLFNTSTRSATFTFGSASVDTNFVQYIIYYKAGASGAAITDTAFTSTTDANLGLINYNTATSTTISNLATSTQYVLNIWAYDSFSNTPAASEVTFYTLANTPAAPTLSGQTTTTLDVAISAGDTNPATVEYAIQEVSSTNYVQSDGTLGVSAVWATKTAWGTKTVIGRAANTVYTFKVKARNGDNLETAFSATSSVTTLANNATSLVASNSTITSTYRIDLSWTNAGQTGMKLERDNSCNGTYDVTLYDNTSANETSPTTTLSSLAANTCYRFRISTYNSAGTLNSTDVAVSSDITTPPAAPTGLTATAITTSTVTWSWDVVTGATTYYVYNSSSVLIDTVVTTSSQQTGLTVSTTYSVFVRAANANGTGVSSSIATAITGPSAPTGLTVNSLTTTTITWGWTNGGQYQFYAQNKNNTPDNSGWITDIFWLQSALTANTAYTLQVKSRDAGSIESGFTEITRYTAQNIPTSTTFATTTTSSITVVINGNFINLGVGSSLIHIANNAGGTQDLTNTTTWQNTGLNFGELYTYTVYATNGDGTQTATATGSKYTLAAAPLAPTVNLPTSSTLNIAITSGDLNSSSVQYAIQETGSGNYVQANGSLSASAYWAVTSSWANMIVTGLSVNTQYTFKAKARNGENTETAFGPTASLYTYANVPGAPTLGSAATSSLSVTIDTNSNPDYTTYAIYNNTAGNYGAADGSPSASPVWQASSTWTANYVVRSLSPNTSYQFSVIARNGDSAPANTSTQSAAKYTLASNPSSVSATADSPTQITLSWAGDATSSYVENITASTTSGWISGTSHAFSGLTCATSYSFIVKGVNAESVETSWSATSTVLTTDCAVVDSGTGGVAMPVSVVPPPVIPPILLVEPEIIIPEPTVEEELPVTNEPVVEPPTPPIPPDNTVPSEIVTGPESSVPSGSETTLPGSGGSSGGGQGGVAIPIQTSAAVLENDFWIAVYKVPEQIKDIVFEAARDIAAKAVQVNEIINEVKNLPEVIVAAEQIAPQVTASAVAVSSVTLFPWPDVLALLRLLFLQPILMLGRPKKSKVGQVYNTLSKLPVSLALVRLIDVDTNRILQTRVTDSRGNYFFIVNPGRYRLEVKKNDFNFPSALLAGSSSDGRKADIYHGDIIEVAKEGEENFWLAANVPVDPSGEDKKLPRLIFDKLRKRVQEFISWIGLIFTALSFYISPKWYIAVLFVVHIVLYVLFRYLLIPKKSKNWGVISTAHDNKPVFRAVARLFNVRFNKLVATEVTDNKGRYSFLAGDDQYYISIEHSKYNTSKSEVVDRTNKEPDVIAPDLSLR